MRTKEFVHQPGNPLGQETDAQWHACAFDPSCALCSNNRKDAQYLLRLEQCWRVLIGGNLAVCICLKDRPDRLKTAERRFHAYGLCRLVQFFRPLRPSAELVRLTGARLPGALGVWISHQTVAGFVLQTKINECGGLLVFEDDVDFLPAGGRECATLPTEKDISKFSAHLDRAVDARRQLDRTYVDSWDVLYLGHAPTPFKTFPVSKVLLRTQSCLLHAYVLSPTGIRKLASAQYPTLRHPRTTTNSADPAIDEWVRDHLRQYAVFPQFAVQCQSASSNSRGVDNSVLQMACDKLMPLCLEMHRRHTLVTELFLVFIVPLLIVILAILLLAFFFSCLTGQSRA